MAFTFIDYTPSHIDNGSVAGPSLTLGTPGAQVGDLIIIIAQFKGTGTLSCSWQTSGPTINALTQVANGAAGIGRIFWTQSDFVGANNLTISVGSGTTALSVITLLFRPTSATNTIDVDVAQVASSYTAPASPFTVTINGVTTVANSTVAVAAWMSDDDNTWGTLTGTGWTKTGLPAQLRNLQGQDQSLTVAYNIQTSPGALANVSQNQTALGGDAGERFIVVFKETASTPVTYTPYSFCFIV